MKQTLTAEIAAKYWGSKVWHPTYGICEMKGLFADSLYISCGFDPFPVGYENCRLALTPLSQITDEHAETVTNMCNAAYPHSVCLYFDKSIVKEGYRLNVNRSSSLWNYDVVDYLRSKSYDLDGLIKSGAAVDKSTL